MRKLAIYIYFIFGCARCFGGWYECYNYEGKIGKYPIIVSLQIMSKDSPQAQHIEVMGNYRYASRNEPILLVGNLDIKDSQMTIYEFKKSMINGDFNSVNEKKSDSAAVFRFKLDLKTVNGSWTDIKSRKSLPLHLKFVSRLNDIHPVGSGEIVEIPQNFSTPTKYFVGGYRYNPAEDSQGKMIFLKIHNKSNNSLFQIMDFSKYSVPMGNVSTPIHANVSITENGFWVWANIGKMGAEVEFLFDKKKNRYKISAEGKNLLGD